MFKLTKIAIGVLLLGLLAAIAAGGQAKLFFLPRGTQGVMDPLTITGVSISCGSSCAYTSGVASGTVLGNLNATLSAGSFTGTWSTSGTDGAKFSANVGNQLKTNSSTSTCTSTTVLHLNIVATQPGVTNPFSQAITVTCNPSGGGGVACDFGPNTVYPGGAAGTDLAASGNTHCVLNADFTDNSGAVTSGGFVMNNPNTWLNQCKGTTSFGLFWLMWTNNPTATNGDQGGPAACGRMTMVSDGAVPQVATFQVAQADRVDSNHLGLALYWPQCGNSCAFNVALPVALYMEVTYRLSAVVSEGVSPIVNSLDSSTLYDSDPNMGAGGFLDLVILEALANNHSGTGWQIDNYTSNSPCQSGKCSSGFVGSPDLGNYHTIATLITTDGTSTLSVCQYMDNAGMTLAHQTFNGAVFDGTYCQHVSGFVANELNPHDRRFFISLGQDLAYTWPSPTNMNIKSVRIFACTTYAGRGNDCPGSVIWH